MAPRDLVKSTLGFKYPENRHSADKSVELWLQDKQKHDGAEGLWRIHDDIYDLSSFAERHPGGKFWIEVTKGTDITEAFETHHIFPKAEALLKKFHVKKATTKRHAPYTFKEDGFYRTLKNNVREELSKKPDTQIWKTNAIIDGLFILTFTLAILYSNLNSLWLLFSAGACLCFTVISAHSYFHQRDNFRMFYFQLSFLTVREWRISHALSHHLLTNTIYDLEISTFEPLLEYLPIKNKKISSVIKAPLVWLMLFHIALLMRLSKMKMSNISLESLIPLCLPLAMATYGTDPLLVVFLKWNAIMFVASFLFGFIGLNAGHHHPESFHDGDAVRNETDWGLHQLDAVIDKSEAYKSRLLSLVTFGDHAMHHFFPTLDPGTLQHLHPIFEKTLRQFGVDLRLQSQINLLKGGFQQLLKTEPSANPPDLLKYSKR